ncbi:MAG: hypothetical protein KUG73_08740 [Pseudomonadales bacterium]|nr:hypothetical protein [Pseudomonadales bacterium]
MKVLLLSVVLFCVAGCSNMEIRQIADSISDMADGRVPSNLGTYSSKTEPSSGYKHQSQQYVNETESFTFNDATRQNNDLGLIRSVTYEKNPKGLTMVRFLGYQQDSGADIATHQYMYKIVDNGWLNKKPVVSFNNGAFAVNSGAYYLKGQSARDGFHVSGDVLLKRGVTNVVSLELE